MYKINLLENYSSSQSAKKSILKKLSFISGLLLVLQLLFSSLTPMNIKPIPATATGGSCHLTITKSVDKTSALPGDILNYTISYANTGTAVCTGGGVQVFDTLNSHLTYVANSKTIVITNDGEGDGYDPSQGNNYNGHGNDLLYNVRRVSPGESGVVTLQATVGAFSCGNYQIPNKGKIWSDQTNYILSNQVTTSIDNSCALVQVPVKTCTGSGELYLFKNNQFQTINATFTVQRDRLLIFSRGDYLSSLAVDVNGTPRTPSLIKDIASPFPVKIYEITTVANDLVHITGVVTPTSLGARAIQGFLAQNAATPVYDTASLQVIYDAEQANDMYLTPGQYNYVFFDKYTYNNDGTDDSRNLHVIVDGGPAGSLVNQSYTKPAPVPTNGVVVGSYNVPANNAGTYTLHINTEDSVYWLHSACAEPVCGDGIINGTEQCDDANDINTDDCLTNCTLPICGDGNIWAGHETCDDSANNGLACTPSYGGQCSYCSGVCQTVNINGPYCGDGFKNGPEECDGTDGVGLNQSCSATCTLIDLPYCGNAVVDSGEACDDGNDVNTDDCLINCTLPTCGDGNIWASHETCDNNGNNGLICTPSYGGECSYCSEACEPVNLTGPFCGDLIRNGPEVCDGTQGVGVHQSCSQTCTLIDLTYCGDSIKQTPNTTGTGGPANDGNEACDGTDGVGLNQSCSQTCTLTDLPYCGNGVIDSGETCDDGNTSSGDGCSATCQTEGGGEQNGSLKICKYKDADGLASTTNDRVIVSDWSFSVGDSVATSSQVTLADGCTIFSSLTPNEYLVAEELKTGWRYFEPANGMATSTVIANQQTVINFYNYRNTYCGDGIKQSPNEMLLGGPANDGNEACDGTDGVGANQSCTATCTLTNLPYCGDNVCSNNESCSSCSTDCGSCGGGGGGGGGGIILTGLTFNNLGSVSNLCSTVLVNWSTSEFATSRVLYDTVSHPDISAQTSPNYGYASSTLLDATPVTGHSVAITGLTPSATYYLRPVSTTASGEKVSNELTVVVNSNCGQVLGVKITAPAPPAGQVLGVKILKATGFSSNELSWLIAIILLLYGSSGILRKYAGVYA